MEKPLSFQRTVFLRGYINEKLDFEPLAISRLQVSA